MTVLAAIEPRSLDSPATNPELSEGEADRRDEEQAFPNSQLDRQVSHDTHESTAVGTSANFVKRKTSRLLEIISVHPGDSDTPISAKLAELVEDYNSSEIFAELKQEIQEAQVEESNTNVLPDVALENNLTRGRQRASWGTQFRILSGRAFKNLYRDPALLAAHYVAAVVLAGAYLKYALTFFSTLTCWESDLRYLLLSLG